MAWFAPSGRAIDAPASPGALPEVQALLSYMDVVHGTHILSGQQELPDWFGDNQEAEIDYIFDNFGKYPAVRGFDLMFMTDPRNTHQRVAERAIVWARDGGIVTICLHWFMETSSPNGPAFYRQGAHATQYTNFSLAQALIDGTPENVEFVTELDLLAGELKILRDARVPVIWRPFHECGGNWFWWSGPATAADAARFKQAWIFMFERFTNLHGLTNLIWEYNPINTAVLPVWYPGDEYVDLISLDVYPASGHPVFAAEYNAFRDFRGGRKLVAISENGRIPDPDQLTAQNAHWVYFCTWDRDFITSNTFNDFAFKQNVFNHERVLTRDELPKVYLWDRAPQFMENPASHAVDVGVSVTLTAAADANETFAYQWYRNGASLAGETNATLDLANLQPAHSGSYTVRATSAWGTTTSGASAVVVGPRTGRLVNLSTRGQVDVGDDVMIAGFYVGGSTPRTLLVRAVGPGLVPYGLAADAVLENPSFDVVSNGVTVMSNDDWATQLGGLPAVAPVANAVNAFPLEATSTDAALVGTFEPGGYTAVVSGVGATTGVVLTELYDVSGEDATSQLVNISTRGLVGTGGAIMIPGIVVSQAGRRLLVRGVGPGLDGLVSSPVLPDPILEVVDQQGNVIFTNDDWGSTASSPAVAAAFTATSAFPLADGSADAAIVVDLPPGQFTALVSGKSGGTGVALVEIYEMAP